MFQDFRADDKIKAVAFKGQAGHIHAGKIYGSAGEIVQILMKRQFLPGFNEIVKYEIRTHTAGILSAASFNGMTAFAAPDIQNPVARPDIQLVKINGKHG